MDVFRGAGRLAFHLAGLSPVLRKYGGGAAFRRKLSLVYGKVGTTADYCTRSISSSGATKGVLIFDAIIPAGAAVTPKMREDEEKWQEMTKAGTVNQGDGLVEFRYELALSGGDMVKARIELSGTATARPRVRNIRMLAVK